MGLREAIKISNVPIYQELARRIGIERMRKGVRRLGYGNMEIGSVVDRFWLVGPLAISAVEQTQFLHRLVTGSLPIDPKAQSAVREITLLEKTDTYELHGKAGWLVGPTPPQIGWWVGWIERENKVYPFALNFDIRNDGDASQTHSNRTRMSESAGQTLAWPAEVRWVSADVAANDRKRASIFRQFLQSGVVRFPRRPPVIEC